MLMLSQFIGGITNPVYNVNQVSLRQAITPDRLQGRMNASMRFIVWGTIPLGALLGGGLGEALGLRPTIALMAVCSLLAPLWVLLSPVRQLRAQPQFAQWHTPRGTHTGGAHGSHPCRVERCRLGSPAAQRPGPSGPLV